MHKQARNDEDGEGGRGEDEAEAEEERFFFRRVRVSPSSVGNCNGFLFLPRFSSSFLPHRIMKDWANL